MNIYECDREVQEWGKGGGGKGWVAMVENHQLNKASQNRPEQSKRMQMAAMSIESCNICTIISNPDNSIQRKAST